MLMTTSEAAQSSPSRSPQRLLLTWIVPPVYVLALVVAAALGASATTPKVDKSESGAAPAAMRVTIKRAAASARSLRHHRHQAPHQSPDQSPDQALHRSWHRARPAPTRSAAAEVSRSTERVDIGRAISARLPRADLVVRIAAVTTSATMQQLIDACRGPVAIYFGSDPSEIAEHDYCGGSAFTSLGEGQYVRVIGGGLSGLYRANGNRRYAVAGASSDVLDGMGDIVLQTCVRSGVILIGLDRVG